ncbi:UNVERIFIED_CONTAM: putative trafficking protein particle complex subunit [Sesamum latifolium]|uniref:Trafficking protein particle complex subunit n=2 Tax=Sesamum TaxID=4181 RepID=A0AAW2YDK1_9LAMI
MASTACFMIVSKNDIPIYEAEVGSVPKKEDAAHQHQFILHAALDIVQDMAWTTSAMFLKAIDRFNDLVVSVYVTAGIDIAAFNGVLYCFLNRSHLQNLVPCSLIVMVVISAVVVILVITFLSVSAANSCQEKRKSGLNI